MSNEENKGLTPQVIETFNSGDIESLKEMFTNDFVWHYASTPLNKEQFLVFTHSIKEPFPDFAFTIEDIVAENDKVVVRLVLTGTHKGVFQGIAPTEKRFQITGFALFQITNGKISEAWENLDTLGQLQQLGMTGPAPAASGPQM